MHARLPNACLQVERLLIPHVAIDILILYIRNACMHMQVERLLILHDAIDADHDGYVGLTELASYYKEPPRCVPPTTRYRLGARALALTPQSLSQRHRRM